jgi:polar amino acid transport system permease protein
MNFPSIMMALLSGMVTTVEIFLLTLVFSLPLGLLICFGRMAKNPIVSWIFRIYISVMRGTPLMLQLFVVFFGPYYIFGISLSTFGPNWRFIAVVIGFVLNYAAYFAEIFRSGISSVPVGQNEAARVLGYTRGQTFLRIILPQMVRRVMPTVTNETITLVKDTSLAFSIGVIEMFTQAKQLANSLTNLMPFVAAGIFYYVFNFLVAFIMERIEKKLNYYSIR